MKKVVLLYSLDEGASWINVTMNFNSTSGLWEGSIPGQPAGTQIHTTPETPQPHQRQHCKYSQTKNPPQTPTLTPLTLTLTILIIIIAISVKA